LPSLKSKSITMAPLHLGSGPTECSCYF